MNIFWLRCMDGVKYLSFHHVAHISPLPKFRRSRHQFGGCDCCQYACIANHGSRHGCKWRSSSCILNTAPKKLMKTLHALPIQMTFGSRVLDWELTSFSFKHEVISLIVCVFTGMLVALASFWTESAEEWPTEEMASRGTLVGLVAGVAIAIPSGMGVALSILGNNTASLVGVAISASLLPPAVNAGLCWMYALLVRVGAAERTANSNYDFGMTGTISLALTVINILCIWFAGVSLHLFLFESFFFTMH